MRDASNGADARTSAPRDGRQRWSPEDPFRSHYTFSEWLAWFWFGTWNTRRLTRGDWIWYACAFAFWILMLLFVEVQ